MAGEKVITYFLIAGGVINLILNSARGAAGLADAVRAGPYYNSGRNTGSPSGMALCKTTKPPD